MPHDKELIERRFSRRLNTYDTLASVQRAVAGKLAGLIRQYAPGDSRCGFEIGSGTGFLTRHLAEDFPAVAWTANDIVAGSHGFLPPQVEFVHGDGEGIRLGKRIDIIASASAVQWFDDLPGFILRSRTALSAGGLLALSTFGPGNFKEIRRSTGQGLEYTTLAEIERNFENAGLEVLLSTEWLQEEEFASPLDVLRHLRDTGVNAAAPERWTPARLRRFENEYPRTSDGRTVLTFQPQIIIGRKAGRAD